MVGAGFPGVISFGPISTEPTARPAASRGLFLSMKHFYRLLSFCFHYGCILPPPLIAKSFTKPPSCHDSRSLNHRVPRYHRIFLCEPLLRFDFLITYTFACLHRIIKLEIVQTILVFYVLSRVKYTTKIRTIRLTIKRSGLLIQ